MEDRLFHSYIDRCNFHGVLGGTCAIEHLVSNSSSCFDLQKHHAKMVACIRARQALHVCGLSQAKILLGHTSVHMSVEDLEFRRLISAGGFFLSVRLVGWACQSIHAAKASSSELLACRDARMPPPKCLPLLGLRKDSQNLFLSLCRSHLPQSTEHTWRTARRPLFLRVLWDSTRTGQGRSASCGHSLLQLRRGTKKKTASFGANCTGTRILEGVTHCKQHCT